MSNPVIITPGLKFTSVHFAMTAEVKAVHEKENQVEVMLTSTEGHSWIEKDWNLQHMKWGFEKKEYNPIVKDTTNISVY